ncbi:hypothetical protein Bca4012_046317 [Brassica carinata]
MTRVDEGEATRARVLSDYLCDSIPVDFVYQITVGITRRRSEDFNSIWGFRIRIPNPEGGFDFLVKIDKLVRSRMDPATEIRETKRKKEYINMLANMADSETEIPTRCPSLGVWRRWRC